MKLEQRLSAGARVIQNFVLGGNLVGLRWLNNPRELAGYNAETLFLYKVLARRRGLPTRNVFEALGSEDVEPILLGALDSGRTWFHTVASYSQDIVSLCLTARLLKPRTVFEIGTGSGYTSLHFALNSPPEARVYTLDVPRGGAATRMLKTTAMDELQVNLYAGVTDYLFCHTQVQDKVTCLYGDSATFDFMPYYGQVDLFFIDGAHSYEYVRSDTLNALKCCHPGSVICWHDFGRAGLNGVSRWLCELARERAVYAIPGGSLAFMVVT